MPIAETDIQFRYSGGATNTNPNTSLGGAESSTAFASNVANNLFDNVSGAEASAGDTEYRCFFVHNNHATLALQGSVIWIDALTTSTSTEFDIGLDGAAVGTSTSASSSTDENVAPSPAITFSRPTTKGTGLTMGDIGAGQMKAVWIRRTVSAGAAAASDSGSIRVEGETAA